MQTKSTFTMQPTNNNVYQFQADKAWISLTTSTHTLII